MGKFSMRDDIELKETSLGGGSFLWDSNVYKCIVDMAYFDKSAGGAHSLNLTLLNSDGKHLKQTLWFTKKTGEIHYVNKRTGEKAYLPGYTLANNLALIITGEDINEAFEKSEKKMVNVYDFTAKAEKPTEKSVATSLLGKQVKAAILKQTVNKMANFDGTWVNTTETKEENDIKEFYFDDSDLTVVEKSKGATEALMMPKWVKRNEGKTMNRVKAVPGDAKTAGAYTPTDKPAGKKLFN